MNELKKIEIPWLLEKNMYFFTPGMNSSRREERTKYRISVVADFFEKLDFQVETETYNVYAKRQFKGQKIKVHFYYQESAANFYKNLETYRDDKLSNITIIKKIVKEMNGE